MSYHPFGDNPELNGLEPDTYERLVPLGDLIEASHVEGYHQEACGCSAPTCWTREHHGTPSTEEVLGWLVAKGLLTLDAIEEAAKAGRAAHIHSPGCMCVMVPMEVEGARECFHCGTGSTGGPCGNRCAIARAETDDRASALTEPDPDVYDVAGPEPSADVLALHDPAGVDINGGYLHRCVESGWFWSSSADTVPSPYFKNGLEWGVPDGSVCKRAQGPLVVVRRKTSGDEAVARG